MRRPLLVLTVVVLILGCGMQDTSTPVPQPDSLILGRISAIREIPAGSGVWEVEIQEGLPEQMQNAMRREGRLVPTLDKDVTVRVRVTSDTACIASLRAGDLDDFRVG